MRASRCSRSARRRAPGSTRTRAVDDGSDPQAGSARVRRARPRRCSAPRATAGTVVERMLDLAAVALAAEQVGGAPEVPRHGGRVRQGAGAVRPADRQLPGHQAQVRGHAARSRVGEVRRVLRGLWARRRAATTSCPLVASLAKAYCSEAYSHAAAENIQIHGGIGFTWEHPAHLYFKRAKSSELLFGDPTYHRELLAQRIGI